MTISSPIIPTWSTSQSRTRYCTGRYMLKVVAVGLTAVILLYTVQNVYSPDTPILRKPSIPKIQGSLKIGNWGWDSSRTNDTSFREDTPPEKESNSLATPFVTSIASSVATSPPATITDPSPFPLDGSTIPDELVLPSSSAYSLPIAPLLPTPTAQALRPLQKVGKVSILFGGRNPTYERALRTQEVHNDMHGYPMFVLRQMILDDVWSKPAYILSVLLAEMAKPEHERLEWLVYVYFSPMPLLRAKDK